MQNVAALDSYDNFIEAIDTEFYVYEDNGLNYTTNMRGTVSFMPSLGKVWESRPCPELLNRGE